MGLYRLLGVIHALLIFLRFPRLSPGTTFLIEEYMVHDGVNGVAELAGQTTYRFYLQLMIRMILFRPFAGDQAPLIDLDAPMFNSVFAAARQLAESFRWLRAISQKSPATVG